MVAAEDLYDKLLEAHIQIGRETKRMVIFSEKKFRPQWAIPSRYPSRPLIQGSYIFIIFSVSQLENDVYRVGTKEGLIKGWFPRTGISKSGTNAILLNDLPSDTCLSLRGHSTLDPRKKAISVNCYEIIKKYVDIEFVRLNSLKTFFSFILYTFYIQKRQSNATPRKVGRSCASMEFWTWAIWNRKIKWF